MYVMQKITTAFRGVAREGAEKVVDANAIRIFEQEIYDCENAMALAKHDLAKVMAEKIRLQRVHEQRLSSIQEREGQAGEALDKGLDSLAKELAEWIFDQEKTLATEKKALQTLKEHEAKLRKSLNAAANHIQHYRRELRLVQATQSSQRATSTLTCKANSLGARIMDMQESLDRIRTRQSEFEDYQEAVQILGNEFSDDALDAKLEKAGIGSGSAADAVLERIKKNRNVNEG
ncbi:phage shock protein A [Hahella sp. CCB-MM4]|uniref:PspA/IM30 family protein n=1 Tax=Hahella sp. (strain CCB-MM4) TaxID=1926491 RepID=UPI000B9B0EBA|nr:PspA/IM30 family protein [Hahella sp. CCB-MM4]OZG74533.1 phage shock protein A [Hahella sp. CCB-MM4]